MLGGGLGLLPSLEHLTKDESLVFSETVRGICDTLISGRSFSFALKNYSNIFPKVCVSDVSAPRFFLDSRKDFSWPRSTRIHEAKSR